MPRLGFGASAIFEGVHLFRDDVGFFADAAGEEFGAFEDGRADFLEVIVAEDVATGGLDEVPQRRFRRRRSRVPRMALIKVGQSLSLSVNQFVSISVCQKATTTSFPSGTALCIPGSSGRKSRSTPSLRRSACV